MHLFPRNFYYICGNNSNNLMIQNKIKQILNQRGRCQTWLAERYVKALVKLMLMHVIIGNQVGTVIKYSRSSSF